jgi:DnaK suppressor protein
MDGKTLQQIRELLTNRWQSLGIGLAQSLAESSNQDTHQAEIIDIAQSVEQIGRDASLKEVERKELAAIERALAKMSTGNFGVCEECNEEISAKRLMVLPEARLCAHCQTYEERQNQRTRFAASAR